MSSEKTIDLKMAICILNSHDEDDIQVVDIKSVFPISSNLYIIKTAEFRNDLLKQDLGESLSPVDVNNINVFTKSHN